MDISECLRRITRGFSGYEAAGREAARTAGMSESAHIILYMLLLFGGTLMLTDLQHLTELPKQTINSALRHLEQSGCIANEKVGARKKRILLTAGGRALAEQTAGKVIDLETEILRSWSPEDRQKYIELSEDYTRKYMAGIRALSAAGEQKEGRGKSR
ncbi:MAG: winged helix-turn-helix transcriptional regulator [Clostridia bacterium]|nr:winged helix-turn-helix transcriptional regulator [Clostridia bacterium]